jgi:protein phosphatase
VAARLLVTLAVLAGIAAGLVLLSRQVFFLGTDDRGLLTLYRGLPYDGPLGTRLYTDDYHSAIPVRTIPPLQRQRILDHELRWRDDAADLVRRLEIARAAAR